MALKYVTLANLKTYCGTAEDVTSWGELAEALVDTVCRRGFTSVSDTIYLDGNDTDTIFCGKPIVSVTTLTISGSAISSGDYKVYTESPNGMIKLIFTSDDYLFYSGAVFKKGYRNVVVVGNFGASTVPTIIDGVVKELTKRLWKKGGLCGVVGESKSLKGASMVKKAIPGQQRYTTGYADLDEFLGPYTRRPVGIITGDNQVPVVGDYEIL